MGTQHLKLWNSLRVQRTKKVKILVSKKKNDFKNIEKSVNKIKRALNKRKLIDQQEHI